MSWWLSASRLLNRFGVPYPWLNYTISGCFNIVTELKFEITERCNLACSFCHQDFGEKGGTDTLTEDSYERLLLAARRERIRIVRLTGGEPLVLKSVGEYLKRAKELGFAIVVNTNATGLTDKRLRDFRGLIDCFKVSLPAADEQTMTQLTGSRSAWRLKMQGFDLLEQHGFRTHVLTVMTAENIRRFECFLDLFKPRASFSWKPLRAETQDGCRRPVSRDDIRSLAAHISEARRQERWKDLTLGLATPFCALENPYDGLRLFSGGTTCGPVQSLTATSAGEVVRCYSRRDPLDVGAGLRNSAHKQAVADFERLPPVCRHCPLSPLCRGGCLCEWALEETPFGRLDYLADPAAMAHAGQFAADASVH